MAYIPTVPTLSAPIKAKALQFSPSLKIGISQGTVDPGFLTYNQVGITYDQVGYTYGGFAGYADILPISIAAFSDIYIQTSIIPPQPGNGIPLGSGFFMFVTQ